MRRPIARNIAPRSIPYGPGARHVIDFFPGDDKGPIVVFIHGGYWQALDGSFFSHLARGLNAHGIGVAIPSYDLCPDVSVDQIIGEMRMASRELARLGRPSGHQRPFRRRASGGLHAGDRLAGIRCLAAADLVIAAYAISGLFDLGPLVDTSINKAMGLDQEAARAASPLFWQPPARGSLDAVVGENESAEYFRQSRTIVDLWGKGRRRDAVRHGSRRQPLHGDCPARRGAFADGVAPEGIGGAR